MLAHSGIAALALSADLRDSATANIDAALKIADKLAGDTAKINAEHPLLATRFTDQSKAGTKNYWLPLPEEKLTVRQRDEVLARRQPDRIEETGLQSMRMHMFLDTASVQRELRRAKPAMDEGNYGIARDAIRIAKLSSLSEATETAEPLERARDDLVLAREVSAQKNCASARRTLECAKAELDALQAGEAKFRTDRSTVRLQADMDTLAKALGRKEPGAFDRAYADIGRWFGQLDGWIGARTPK